MDAKGPAVHWVTGARPSAVHPGQLCVFEFVYFARADSVIHGCSVQEARLRAGRLLAKEQPRDADVVIGVPDSGLEAAMGYAGRRESLTGSALSKTGMWAVPSSSRRRIFGSRRSGSSWARCGPPSKENGW